MVEKPWGRTELPAFFGPTGGKKVGEIWYTGPEDTSLLIKAIFTSERLSIQNHPSDEQARARGLERGKEECWYILDAEPNAVLGLGLKREVGCEELRAAAVDGSIEHLIDWKPARAGDFFYVSAGTVHAVGAGLTLFELQQNADVTYRLYDYGRPRDLHVDDGIAVAEPRPYSDARARHVGVEAPSVLVDGPHFSLVHAVKGQAPTDSIKWRRRWVLPLDGTVFCAIDEAGPGECLLVEAADEVDLGSARVLMAVEGSL
jgi:mannose-6-phosphate isomerase